MRVDAVDADTVDADLGLLEVDVVVPKLGKLIPSTGCEVEHVEGDHSCAVAPGRLGKADRTAPRGRQLEVGGSVFYFKHGSERLPAQVTGRDPGLGETGADRHRDAFGAG